MPTITTSFATLSTGVTFNRTTTQTVRAFLTTAAFNNILIHVSGPGIIIPGNNLTSQGLLPDGNTAWRITTSGSPPANLTLTRLGGGFFQPFPALPANSYTFVKGGAAGNYVLSGDNFTKQLASGTQQNGVWNLLTTDFYNITGSELNDSLTGANVADTLVGLGGNDTLVGLGGNDSLDGLGGNDSLDGGTENDTLLGGDGNDTLIGDAAADHLHGQLGDDSLNGGAGADTLFGNDGTDTLLGGSATDSLDGGAGTDSLDGGSANDTLFGGTENDTLFGDTEDDSLDGGTGNDTLFGGDDDDILIGGDGNDFLTGGTGNDSLTGGDGDDFLTGGDGTDTLTGGNGPDFFVYNNITDGIDSITDFNVAEDFLVFSPAANFPSLNLGTTLIYNSVTGDLSFNGNQLATLSTGLALTSANILTLP
jgi:Ca2+-binding RTX toxin-like protein